MVRHWLVKSEPHEYSIEDLERDGSIMWSGVRNYQARNFMRDEMKLGDLVLYYHSNTKPPGVVGLAKVCKESHPDPLQFDEDSRYHDEKATREEPRWFLVDLEFVEQFPRKVSLAELKDRPDLEDMLVVQRGQRLSVQPVEEKHFEIVCHMARET